MVKELMLVPRLLYCGFFIFVLALNMPVVAIWILVYSFAFLLIFSFVWQYYVLHQALQTMERMWKLGTLFIWLIGSFVISSWGLYALVNLDLRDEEVLLQSLVHAIAPYLIGTSMFVGGFCTRRAWQEHNAL